MKHTVITITALFVSLGLHSQSKRLVTTDSLLTEMTRQDLFSGAVVIADSSGVLTER